MTEELNNTTQETVVEELSILTKDQILQADDLSQELIYIPEWKGSIYVAEMTAQERDELEESMTLKKEDGTREQNLENFRAKLCALTIRNKNGKRMFDTSDVKTLGQKSARAIGRIYDAACRLNGIGEKDVENLSKN